MQETTGLQCEALPTVTVPGYEVLHLPPAWIMEHFAPTEARSWPATRALFEVSHTHLDALRDHLATHGVLTPVELNPVRWEVERGHHRLLLGLDADLPYVPAIFGRRDETTYWDPDTGLDVACDPDDWDDEDWDDEEELPPWHDVVYPVPAQARAVARS